jgi:hypothetical protein
MEREKGAPVRTLGAAETNANEIGSALLRSALGAPTQGASLFSDVSISKTNIGEIYDGQSRGVGPKTATLCCRTSSRAVFASPTYLIPYPHTFSFPDENGIPPEERARCEYYTFFHGVRRFFSPNFEPRIVAPLRHLHPLRLFLAGSVHLSYHKY